MDKNTKKTIATLKTNRMKVKINWLWGFML